MRIREAVDPYDRKTSSYIVAYMDILGATNRINQSSDSQNAALNTLHNLYTFAMGLAAKDGIRNYAGIKFKIFSDNIIIAKELQEENFEQDVTTLLNCVSNFLCSSVGDSVGWLVRGGITIGELFIDDTIVWGTALIRAYELEDKAAIYPRIILDQNVVSLLEHSSSDYLRKDVDGMHYLNYMSIWYFSATSVNNAFEKMKAEAQKRDGTYPDRVYQKLYWHMNYINRELDSKNERRDRNIRLSI